MSEPVVVQASNKLGLLRVLVVIVGVYIVAVVLIYKAVHFSYWILVWSIRVVVVVLLLFFKLLCLY